MKIVIAGGTGYLGKLLTNYFLKNKANHIYILSRKHKVNTHNIHYLQWDGETEGYWVKFLEQTDVLINLSGKSVNCRYTQKNKAEIYNSRIKSTHLLCKVINQLKQPPKQFIQSSSATIYNHELTKKMTEKHGKIGNDFSMDVCKKWEMIFNIYKLPKTTKIITRTAIVFGENGGALPLIKKLTQIGLGGKQGQGNQLISYITEEDFTRAINFLIKKNISGIYNLSSPNSIKNKDFQELLRKKLNITFGLNTPKWLLQIGAKLIGTEPELVLKSRNVYPENLISKGFQFKNNLKI